MHLKDLREFSIIHLLLRGPLPHPTPTAHPVAVREDDLASSTDTCASSNIKLGSASSSGDDMPPLVGQAKTAEPKSLVEVKPPVDLEPAVAGRGAEQDPVSKIASRLWVT